MPLRLTSPTIFVDPSRNMPSTLARLHARARPPGCSNVASSQSRSPPIVAPTRFTRSEEHTSELQSLMRISYAVFCLKKKKHNQTKKCYSTNQTLQENT